MLTGRAQTTGSNNCFICGASIPPGHPERTREHVFPQWLLRSAGLRSANLVSSNAQLISYYRLTVPCCRTCNGVDFSGIEQRVKAAFENGLEGVQSLSRRDLFLWLGKLYYGVLFLESLRRLDVRDPDSAPLVSEEQLRRNNFHHFLLQAAAGVVHWPDATGGPASFLFVDCQIDEDTPEHNFDYCDSMLAPVTALRVGRVGILAVMQDWGTMETIHEKRLVAARLTALHPTQFREVFAMVEYLAVETAVTRRPSLLVGGTHGATVIPVPVASRDGGSVNVRDFASFLAKALFTTVENLFTEGSILTFTVDDSGDAVNAPWPGAFFSGLDGQPLWPSAVEVQGP
ncbi:hypothetical protein [Microbacterium sp. NPDC055599]